MCQSCFRISPLPSPNLSPARLNDYGYPQSKSGWLLCARPRSDPLQSNCHAQSHCFCSLEGNCYVDDTKHGNQRIQSEPLNVGVAEAAAASTLTRLTGNDQNDDVRGKELQRSQSSEMLSILFTDADSQDREDKDAGDGGDARWSNS